ncbi:MAG: LuxR C-terminal-related transcriptional regulator [Actinomycetota bacterium]
MVARPKRSHRVLNLRTSKSGLKIPFSALVGLLPDGIFAGEPAEVLAAAQAAIASSTEHVVLAADDVHLLDAASATVIDRVVRESDVSLVASLPDGVECPAWLDQLLLDEQVTERTLATLPRDTVAELVVALLGSQVAAPVVEAVWSVSQGNPRVVKEVVRAGRSSGVIARCDGWWRLEGELPLPPVLVGRIERAIRARSSEAIEALSLLALAESLELGLLEALAGSEAIEELEAADIVRARREGVRTRIEISDPVLRLVVVASFGEARRRSLARRLAHRLSASGFRRTGDAVRLAAWTLQGGTAADAELMLRAQREALASGEVELAVQFARTATASGGVESHLALAQTQLMSGRVADAEVALMAATALARRPFESAAIAVIQSRAFAANRSDTSAARAHLKTVGRRLRNAEARELLEAEFAQLCLRAGELDDALRLLERVEVGRSATMTTELRGLVVGVEALCRAGRFDRALEAIGHARRLIDEGADAEPLTDERLVAIEVSALLGAGRVADARAIVDRHNRVARQRGRQVALDLLRGLHGRVALCEGAVGDAGQSLDEALRGLGRFDPLGLRPGFQGLRGLVAIAEADPQRALDAVALVDRKALDPEVTTAVARVRAGAQAMTGTRDEAVVTLVDASRIATSMGHDHAALEALADAVRLGRPTDALDPLQRLAGRVDGELVEVAAAHAAALGDGDISELGAVGRRYLDLGFKLRSAEAAAQVTALARERAGAARRAEETVEWAAARLSMLLDGCPGASAMALPATGSVLTRRQREVAQMAPFASNREIAERLGVSVRTVENHLNTVYRTLDIHAREELRSLFVGANGGFE